MPVIAKELYAFTNQHPVSLLKNGVLCYLQSTPNRVECRKTRRSIYAGQVRVRTPFCRLAVAQAALRGVLWNLACSVARHRRLQFALAALRRIAANHPNIRRRRADRRRRLYSRDRAGVVSRSPRARIAAAAGWRGGVGRGGERESLLVVRRCAVRLSVARCPRLR